MTTRKTTRRETVIEENKRHMVSSTFEERTTATLEAQDRILERVEQKLEAPVLNGGFEDLIKKVDKLETVQETLRDCTSKSSTKIDAIHTAIYDPDKGLYVTVKHHTSWIAGANKASKWLVALMVTGVLTGVGKLIYDFLSGHIHFSA